MAEKVAASHSILGNLNKGPKLNTRAGLKYIYVLASPHLLSYNLIPQKGGTKGWHAFVQPP